MLKKQFKNGWTQVPNAIINHSILSCKAKFLWVYINSKPEGWDFAIWRIAKENRDGEKAIRSGLKELVENGYLEYKPKVKDGKLAGQEYILYDVPFKEPPKQEPPKTSTTQNGGFISNKELNKKLFNKKEKDPVQKKINKLTEFLKIKDTPFEPELIHKLNEKIPGDKLEPYLNYLLNIKMQTEAKEMLLNGFKTVAFYNWYYKDFLGWESLNQATKQATNETIIKKSDYNDQELQNEIEMLKSLNINFKIV